jgi:hypothetical protein
MVRMNDNGKTSTSRDILWELLIDPRMDRPWKQIKRKTPTNVQYSRLWSEILSALIKSRIPEPSRKNKQKHFQTIADNARALANTIAEGPLDRLTYEYFPDEMARLVFRTREWPVLAPDERVQKAHRALSWWPSLPELLEEVGQHAQQLAEGALSEKRLAVNDTQDRRVNYFLLYLGRHFRTQFNAPMKGVLAQIASVVFNKSITLDFVKNALRHTTSVA